MNIKRQSLVIAILLLITVAAYPQSSDVWNLSHNASPAGTTRFWTQSAAGIRAQYVTLSDILLGATPSTRSITCSLPLLCDGGSSMDLSSNRTLSITTYRRNVKLPPYNAVGDGVTDDTAAIQSALNVSGGGIIYLPAGTYKISSTLTMSHLGLWLQGDGYGATTISTSSTTADIIRLGSYTTSGYNKCGGIGDLSIVSSVTRTAGYAIGIDGCEDAELRNMRIATTGGHGIALGPLGSGHLATLIFAHYLDVEITGAYNAISVLSPTAGGYFTDLWLRGNSTTNSIGIYLPFGGGDTWSNIESVLFDVGVKILPTTGNSVQWETFSNFFSDTNNSYGFYISQSAGGTVAGISCVACWASSNGASGTGQGVFLDTAGSAFNFTEPRIVNNGSYGIQIKGTSDVSIMGGTITGNSNSSSNTYDGIYVNSSSSNVRVIGNRIGQTAGALNRQRYGVNLDSSTASFTISHNDLSTNVTAGINNAAGLSSSRIVTANINSTYESFLNSSGLSGGQTWVCGTGSGEDCTITSTSNATKGQLFLGSALTVDQSTARVGIGWTAPDVPLAVSSNTATLPASTVTGTLAHIGGVDGTAARLLLDSFASNASYECRRADTTAASPSAVQSGENICQLSAFGYGASAYSSGGRASFQFQATENWTNSAQGTTWKLITTPVGSTTAGTVLEVDGAGHMLSTQAANPSVSCTGTGTSPAAPTITGTDIKFTVTINTGTGTPGSTGTCTVTYATAFNAAKPIVCSLVKGATAWGNGAVIQETTESASAPVFTWSNLVGGVATALTVSTSYKFSCVM